MQRASFLRLLNFLLLGKGQSIHTRDLLSNLCPEGTAVYLVSPAEQVVQKNSSQEALGGSLTGVGGIAGAGCWGSPRGLGELRGGHLCRQLAHLTAWCLGPSPHSGRAALGASGRVLAHTAPSPQSSPGRVRRARCTHGPAQRAKRGWGYPRYLHETPGRYPAGRTGWRCFLLSPGVCSWVCCLSPRQPGHCSHLFPQLVLVDDAFQLVCQVPVLLVELRVPLALLLELRLDVAQHALEMISYFFPLLTFLPCPLNCFLLLLNGRERGHVSKTHNKRFRKDTVSG